MCWLSTGPLLFNQFPETEVTSMCSSGIIGRFSFSFHSHFLQNDLKDPYLHGCAERDRKSKGMIIHANVVQLHSSFSITCDCFTVDVAERHKWRVGRYDLTLSSFRAGRLKTEMTKSLCVINTFKMHKFCFLLTLRWASHAESSQLEIHYAPSRRYQAQSSHQLTTS